MVSLTLNISLILHKQIYSTFLFKFCQLKPAY